MAQNSLLAHRARKDTYNVLVQIHNIMKQYGISVEDVSNFDPVKLGHNDYIRKEGAGNGWRKQAESSRTNHETASGPSTGAVRKYRREVSDEHGADAEASGAKPAGSK